MYLDYAEDQAERNIPMSMEDWAKRLDSFLEFNDRELLTGPGKISAEQAKLYAESDEVQKITNWEKAVNSLRLRKNFDIYILPGPMLFC